MIDNIAGGMPPSGGVPPSGDAMSANRSVMNPVDMAAMTQNGTVNEGMTVKDLIEKVFKVPIDAPVKALVEAIKRQNVNKDGIGKVGAMATPRPVGSAMGPRNGTGPNSMMPQGQPSAAPISRPPQGLADLMGR